MSNETMLEALGEGIRGELDGITVYTQAAERSEGKVREFFLARMEEEKQHYNWLLDYYQQISLGESISAHPQTDRMAVPRISPILTEDFLKSVGESQYLTTAITTSVLLEFNAMEHYKKSAGNAKDPEVVKLFEELFEWESEHYDSLLKIQEQSRQYWFDTQSFQPF